VIRHHFINAQLRRRFRGPAGPQHWLDLSIAKMMIGRTQPTGLSGVDLREGERRRAKVQPPIAFLSLAV